jgi:hypothetical protein
MSEFKEIPDTKIIGGKRYKLYALDHLKSNATQRSEDLRKAYKRGYGVYPSVRVVPTTNGAMKVYAIYIRKTD